MSSFSKRFGYEAKKTIQINSMDDDLRTGLWNALQAFFWDHTDDEWSGQYPSNELVEVIKYAWANYYKWRLNELPHEWPNIERQIEERFDSIPWFEVYNDVEFFAPFADKLQASGTKRFMAFCNEVLERECSAYRFVDGRLAPITNEEEIAEVEKLLTHPHDGIRIQIASALEKLSLKPKPDLRNSIKDSIGAVETAAKLIDGRADATLPGALARLKKKVDLHGDLERGFKLLYNYTSDESGIRHALMDKPDLTTDDARYMLVSCSAFANYMLRLADRAGLKLKS